MCRYTPRRRRHVLQSAQLLEDLESRVLLNGLTIITHGYEPFSNSRPSWIDAMGNAIKQIAGPTTAVYTLRLEPTNSTTVHVSNFARLSGPASTDSTNGETVLLLDWASVSGILTQTYSVSSLASVVTPYLTQAFPSIGLSAPLAEGSIQLIGHSRGAPFMSEVAKDLGQAGIWVDQVTTLDPVPSPFNNDPAVNLTSNVVFADNYYQTSGDGFLVPNGARVSGAVNIGPLSLGGAYSSLDGGTHNDVHLFYQGTINLASNASDGAHTVPNSWYAGNNVQRALTGFYYSRLEGGTRPASGVSSAFGGSAGRSGVTRSGAQWPNLAMVQPSLASISPGQNFNVTFRYQDYNAASNVQWFLDTDTNPYDGNSIAIGSARQFASTGNTVASGNISLSVSAPSGTYYLEGLITNGSQTRYAYAAAPLVLTAPPTQLAITQQPTSGVEGTVLTPALNVTVQDANGFTVTGDSSTVTLAIASGPGTLSGNVTAQVHNGVATFNNLILSTAGTYTLQATDGSLTGATSGNITITVPPPHLVFTQQPGSAVLGTTFTPLTVTIEDPTGQPLVGDTSSVTLSIASGPAGAALGGTLTVPAQDGVATFSDLSLSKAGTYTLRAADGDFTAGISGSITITLRATHLVFFQQPTSAIAGAVIQPGIVVAVEDANGHIVGSDTSTVALAILSGPTGTGGTFNGTLSVQAVNGVALFQDLSLTRSGSYILLASDGALTGVRSRTLTVNPDTASAHLVLMQASADAVVGRPLLPPITVTVQDQFDNIVRSDRSRVSLGIVDGPTGGTFAGASTVAVSNGTAVFRNVSMTLAGNYTIAASDASLAVTTPVSFAQTVTQGVTALPAPRIAGRYAFGTTAFSTTLKSTAGATAPFTGSVLLHDGDGNLLGSATLTGAGLARFALPGLTPGTYVGAVSYAGDANHTAATSSSFTLNVVMASTTTTLRASASPLVFGQGLTLTATVNSANAPGTTRTGVVTFKDGVNVIGTVTLDGNSTAALSVSNPTLGGHAYNAVYSGDANFKPSTAPSRGITVRKDVTQTTLTSDAVGPLAPSAPVTLSAVVAVLAPGTGTPTGMVTFKEGSKILGTGTLDGTGTAMLLTSFAAVGTHRVTAIYGGDTTDNPSTSLVLVLTVTV